MTLLAALAWGTVALLGVGFVTGHAPTFARPARPDGAAMSARQLWLRQAGVALSPRQFWLGTVLAGFLAFVLGAMITGVPVVALVPALAVACIPRAYFARQRARRMRDLQAAWPDGLRDILASIASGASLTQALTSLAHSGPEPLQVAFARFPLLSRMLGTVPALEVIKEELADPTSDRVVEVLVLAHERGGRVVQEILTDLVNATAKDLKAQDEIASEGLEMKINARAVLVLPWFVLVALTIGDGPFRAFYQGPGGAIVVVIGAVLSAVGYLLISRLGRDQGERRVFGSAALGTDGGRA